MRTSSGSPAAEPGSPDVATARRRAPRATVHVVVEVGAQALIDEQRRRPRARRSSRARTRRSAARGSATGSRPPTVPAQPVAERRARSRSSGPRTAGRSSRAGSGRRPRRRSSAARSRGPTPPRAAARWLRTRPGLRMNVSSSANSRAAQLDLRVAAPDAARRPGRAAGRRPRAPAAARTSPAARQRAQAREQLGERERLGQVVVGAGVEAADAIVDGVARREHDHRRPDALRAQAPAHLEAVGPGEQDVEDHRVEAGGAREAQRVLPVARDVDDEPVAAQAAPHRGRHAHVVLDHEHPHGDMIPDKLRRT